MSRIEEALEKAAQLRTIAASPAARVLRNLPEPEQCPAPDEHQYLAPESTLVKISNPYLVTATRPGSREAEEYRKLKSAIVALTRQKEFFNTLMVTSALGGEGKSITALNLAVTLAQEYDHTVLLVDADLRRPSLHGYLGIEAGIGIADCLTDGIDIGEALIKTGIGKLSFLQAGKGLESPAEMLSSQKMRELFREMKHRYPDRFIVIDTPPVLPVAETRSLGALVDGVVFVVKESGATPDEIKDACAAFDRGKLLGVVYNNAELAAGAHYRYYDYGYGSGQETSGQRPGTGDKRPSDGGERRGFLAKIFRRSGGEQ